MIIKIMAIPVRVTNIHLMALSSLSTFNGSIHGWRSLTPPVMLAFGGIAIVQLF